MAVKAAINRHLADLLLPSRQIGKNPIREAGFRNKCRPRHFLSFLPASQFNLLLFATNRAIIQNTFNDHSIRPIAIGGSKKELSLP